MSLKSLLILFISFFSNIAFTQELNATVSVNAERMTDVNPQIFKNLEKQVFEFLNTTKWTELNYSAKEKIDCNFFINVSEYSSNNITATLQVQSSRSIYNSTYSSPVINFNDKDFSFQFVEFEQLIFDQNNFTSNLTSVLAYYVYIIIGLDRDTFSELGGTKILEKASHVMSTSQTSGYKGWSQSEGNNNNRYFLISDLLSSTYAPYRKAQYIFHRNGLDLMAEDLKNGKEGVMEAVKVLSEIQRTRPNALLTRTFFDAKTDEIVQIFTGGPSVNLVPLVETLNRISPLNSLHWNKIR